MLMTAYFSLLVLPVCDAHAAGDAVKGEAVFHQCGVCHSPAQGVNKVGPSLFGVVGRPAGSISNYQYSKAMQEAAKKGLVWSADAIQSYLVNPHKYLDDFAGDQGAPNKMPFSLADPADRANVVAYLQTLGGK